MTTHAINKTFSLTVRNNSDIDADTESHTVANKHVWRRLMDSKKYRYPYEVATLFCQLSSVPQAAATAGWLFEAMAHQHICEGEPVFLTPMECDGIRLRPNQDSQRSKRTYPILQPSVYDNKNTTNKTKDEGMYYIPSAANNPTFDAFARPNGQGMGFQMTLSSTHSLHKRGLLELRASKLRFR